MEKEQRLSKRHYLISNLEKIIEDSIYYRNYNKYMNESKKISIGPITEKNIEAKIK
jgi:hypothetical protein